MNRKPVETDIKILATSSKGRLQLATLQIHNISGFLLTQWWTTQELNYLKENYINTAA